MDSILKWVISHSWFNIFLFKIVRYDPSFLDRIKRFEKKSPSWIFVVRITFFQMGLGTSSSMILCSNCNRLYSNCTLVGMPPVKISLRPCCTIFKMNVPDVMFVQAGKLFLKLPHWNLSTLICNSEISILKFTFCNNLFFCTALEIFCVVVCYCCPYYVAPFESFGRLTSFLIDMMKTGELWSLLIIFTAFDFYLNLFHCWLI